MVPSKSINTDSAFLFAMGSCMLFAVLAYLISPASGYSNIHVTFQW